LAAPAKLALPAVGFAIAAALSSWNPIAAPFGLVVGLAAAGLAIRALQVRARRLVAVVALIVASAAVAASSLVLALSAGVGREPSGAVVDAPQPAEAERILQDAAERTRAARERAREELGKVGGGAEPGKSPAHN
jgi:hypothetical protein